METTTRPELRLMPTGTFMLRDEQHPRISRTSARFSPTTEADKPIQVREMVSSQASPNHRLRFHTRSQRVVGPASPHRSYRRPSRKAMGRFKATPVARLRTL